MSPAAKNFTAAVERFCAWAEGDCHRLVDARQQLISLMASIPHIEEFRYSGTSDEKFPRRGFEGWEGDRKRFADLPFQQYRVVFNPHELDSSDELVLGDLTDDLADIYGDLWNGLQAHRSGQIVEALSLWVDSYFCHWGHHASSALYAIDEFYRQHHGESE